MTQHKYSNGFTIVELLIVVVVIAILAAITIVSYNGISSKATESALKSDLNTAAKQLGLIKVESGSYPSNTSGIKTSGDAEYAYSATDDTFCLSATKGAVAFKITQVGNIEDGDCGASTPPLATTMQTFTSAMCSSLDMYTGTNEEAVIELTDSRGGTERSYEVAKLADGKCWMLNNLRLGSTTAPITLTPSDSDVASNFTLPQLITSGLASYDAPQAVGPVPGDSGSGAYNHGYLYNFTAATGGETRTSLPPGPGHAQHSICPAGWRLPTGRNITDDFMALDIALGGTGGPQSGTPAHLATGWLSSGAFKGLLSGFWEGNFRNQSVSGNFWSSSPEISDANKAHQARLTYTSSIDPGTYGTVRYYASAVRCLLD